MNYANFLNRLCKLKSIMLIVKLCECCRCFKQVCYQSKLCLFCWGWVMRNLENELEISGDAVGLFKLPWARPLWTCILVPCACRNGRCVSEVVPLIEFFCCLQIAGLKRLTPHFPCNLAPRLLLVSMHYNLCASFPALFYEREVHLRRE